MERPTFSGTGIAPSCLRFLFRWLARIPLALAMLVMFCAPGEAVPPPAGTYIDSTSYFTFTNIPSPIKSNTVRAIVQPVDSFTLVDNRQIQAASGATVTLKHTLTNTGNTISSYTLTLANLTGDGYDINSLTLYRNVDNTGVLSPTDPVIPQGGTITLKPGESAVLVISGVVPANTAAGLVSTIRIGAVTALNHLTVSNTDTINIPAAALLQLTKTASTSTTPPMPGGRATFTVTTANNGSLPATGTGTLGGNNLLVGGVPSQLLLIRDVVPINTSYLAGSISCSPGGTPLFHQVGDPVASYLQAEPAGVVDEVACGIGSLAPGQATMTFSVTINDNASGRITNTARTFYNDGTGNQIAATSNTVELNAPVRPPVITYFTDNTFTRPTTESPLGTPLYTQANAAQCNTDPLTAESHIITIISTLTGDSETFTAIETGPNTGIFRVVHDPAAIPIQYRVPTRDGGTNPVVRGNVILEELKNDIVTATIQGCGSVSVFTSLYIDPMGVVFDSRTNAAIPGAQITLIDVTGAGNGGNPGGPAKVFAMDGTTPVPAAVTTGTDGTFQFPLVAPSTYQLKVIPPNGYRAPSTVLPARLPAGRVIDASGSYGSMFDVSIATGFVRLDIPLDQGPADGLFVEKTSSVAVAELGDFVDYTVKVTNKSGRQLTNVMLTDTLPSGFSYRPGSLRLDFAPAGDPSGGHGPYLGFTLGDVDSDSTITLTYRVKIGPGAFEGDGINRARATAANGTTSNVASAQVKIVGGVFSDKGFIIGKVFLDCNRSRIQDPEELGIPGVRLYMEDGTFVITDSEGKFSLYNISPRTHVLKVDSTSLPAGAEMIELSNRNAGDGRSLFIDMKSGELHKANFAEGSCNAVVMKEVKERRAKGEVFIAETDRSLEKPLTLNTSSPGDVRSLAASGVIGRVEAIPPGTTMTAEGSPKVRVNAGLSAESPAKTGLQDLMPNLDNTLDFIALKDQDVLQSRQLSVRIKGPVTGSIKFILNGVEIPEKRIGTKTTDGARKVTISEYVGVDFKAGINDLELVLLDPFGNQRGKRRIQVTAPGDLGEIAITLPEKEFPADGDTLVQLKVFLKDNNGVPVTSKILLTLESSMGKWQKPNQDDKDSEYKAFVEGGSAEFKLRVPPVPGEAVIKVSSGAIKTERKIYFMPDLRPIIAAGIMEGTINLRNLGSGAVVPARNQDGFEREISSYSFSGGDGKQQGGARAAMFLKGKIKGDCLLTLSYDSDKDTRESLFRDIQPDQFYPVYGDSSVKGFDAQSTGKFYVRIDKNRSYLLYGDYITPPGGDARVLGAYNRSLNGASGHYENTVVRANAFASRDSGTQVIDEIPGQGLSGPYFLTKTSFLANSEKVEIITRDRNQPSLVLKTVPQTRFTDYEIEVLSGRILFKAPVPTLDPDMNPNYIRITYETEQGGDRFWVAGVDAQAKLHPRLEVGTSYVRDENPLDKADVKSANATVKLFEKTYLVGEWAEAFKESIGRGDAERFELRHDGEKLQARVYGVRTDAGFANPNSTFGQGRKEAGAKVTYKAGLSTTISGEALHSEDSVTGGKKEGITAGVQHSFGNLLQAELGVRHARETTAASQPGGVAPNDITSLRTKLIGHIPQLPKLSLTGEYEQSLNYGDRRLAAGGAEYQLSAAGKLYARHEFISSLAGPYNLNGSQQQNSTQVGIDTEYMKEGKVFSEYRIRDAVEGRDAEAAIGLRNGWQIAKGIKLSTTLERIQKLDGATDNTATAVTGALEYTASPLWKGSARLEYRASTTSDTYLNTLGVAYKMNRNVTLLGRQFLSYTDNKGVMGDLVQERLQAGFAYRPTDTDTWNVLSRYEFKYEDNGGAADFAINRAVHIFSTHLNYQPTKALTTTARYAGKLVFEKSNGLSDTSNTHLLSGRTIYDLTSKWDMGLNYSTLFSDFFTSCRYGVGAELGYLVATNLWLSSGYNVFGFKDKDLSGEEYTAQGVYFRFRFKFDEDLFSANDPKINKTLLMQTTAEAGR